MKALDTNALVRFLVRDDEQQAQAVRKILLDVEKKRDALFIPLAMTLETIWVLSSVYEYSKEEIVRAFEDLLILSILEFEERERVALVCRMALRGEADIADLLIGQTACDRGCETTLTFDKKAAKSGLFTLIS